MSVTKRLADQHERFIAEQLGAIQSISSGNQWHSPADGREDRYENPVMPFAFDCKCALPGTKSLSISRESWYKIENQGLSEKPMMPLRFYASERGAVWRDLVVVSWNDFMELRERGLM